MCDPQQPCSALATATLWFPLEGVKLTPSRIGCSSFPAAFNLSKYDGLF